jgi:aminopeptidase N
VEQLVDLLRDPLPQVRWTAAYGLQKMKAPEAITALEGFSHSQSAQLQVVAERIINGLREADKTDGSALKKQVEDLREKVRKLEGELQKLAAKVEPADVESVQEAPPES